MSVSCMGYVTSHVRMVGYVPRKGSLGIQHHGIYLPRRLGFHVWICRDTKRYFKLNPLCRISPDTCISIYEGVFKYI